MRNPKILRAFVNALPRIKQQLVDDAAPYFRRPCADTAEEVLISYPGFYAISIHRFAHELISWKLPLIRASCRNTHSKTGIDIHPVANRRAVLHRSRHRHRHRRNRVLAMM